VLLYAVNAADRHHEAARSWLEHAFGESEAIGFTWPVVLAFLRVSTSDRVFPQPLSSEAAIGYVEGWLAQPASVVVEPTARHLTLLRGLLLGSGTAGNLVGDAHLAALSLELRASIVSFDRDFLRFGDVAVTVPGVD